ncbi:MAG: 2-isopropylmalate synthase [Nitrospirae bacterium]|nr:2-isopropylmalate synthase [Nitrospirota bacterium]
MRTIKIFDTTLRDGEQSPGASMNVDEKVLLAKQLARLGVDIIEAGFAISSKGDFEAIRRIGAEIEGPIVCSLARAREADIKTAYEALKDAPKRRIHTFHSTSDIHLEHQYRISRDEAFRRSVEMVKLARSLVEDVEFSPMDATRTDLGYLCEVLEAVIDAGATTVNIPDTVGYAIPQEFGAMIREIRSRVKNIDKAVISLHCHNDLGLAVANALSAIIEGAGQVECTINGIGERAGNCSMEEVVMALRTRRDYFNADTNINTTEFVKSSRLVTKITGMAVQPNKAIVGANAFAHEAGIHTDGLLKERTTYEIIRPESVGFTKANLVLGKHSGRHAFKARLAELGYQLSDAELEQAFTRFKELADRKKDIFDEDLEALVSEGVSGGDDAFRLEGMEVSGGIGVRPTAVVRLATATGVIERSETGDGPVDAVYRAIAALTETGSSLLKFEVKSITGGTDALGEVTVALEQDGDKVRGHGADTDIIVAAARAYLSAINRLAMRKKTGNPESGV